MQQKAKKFGKKQVFRLLRAAAVLRTLHRPHLGSQSQPTQGVTVAHRTDEAHKLFTVLYI